MEAVNLIRNLSALDFFALLIVLVSVAHYTVRGLVRGLLGICVAMIALVSSSFFYPRCSVYFAPYVKTDTIAHLLGFSSIFVGIVLLGNFIIYLVYKVIKTANLQWFDKILGTVFGFVQGWVLCTVVFLALTAFPVGIRSIEESVLAPYLLFSARVVLTLVPSDLKTRFHKEYEKVVEFWHGVKS